MNKLKHSIAYIVQSSGKKTNQVNKMFRQKLFRMITRF